MSVAIKALLAIATLGVVGSAGYGVQQLLSDNSLGKALKDKGHELLNFNTTKIDDKDTWDPIVKAYSKSTKKLNDKTITVNGDSVSKENIKDLKKECAKVTSSNNYDKNKLSIAEQFCVVPKTVEQLAKQQKGRNVLDATANTDENISEWNTKVNEYSAAATGTPKITSVTLIENNLTNQKANRDKLKIGCKSIEGAKTYETDFHSKYDLFLRWCVV